MNAWQSLLANLAIVAILVSIWTQLGDPVGPAQRSVRAALLAVLLSGGAIAILATPFEIHLFPPSGRTKGSNLPTRQASS